MSLEAGVASHVMPISLCLVWSIWKEIACVFDGLELSPFRSISFFPFFDWMNVMSCTHPFVLMSF